MDKVFLYLFLEFIVWLVNRRQDGPDLVQLVLQGAIQLFELVNPFQELFFSRHLSIMQRLAGYFHVLAGETVS